MKVKEIKITFIDEEKDDKEIIAEFYCGQWHVSGGLYSRILLALCDIWKRLRVEVKNDYHD